jgi:invasion protein IalB
MSVAWPKRMAFGIFLFWASIAGAQQSASPPQATPAPQPVVSSVPQSTTATYGDWILQCQLRAEGAPRRACEVVQTLQLEGKGPIAQILVGRPNPKVPSLVSVILPPNVSFPSSVLLSVDEKDTQPAGLAWQRCTPAGCVAAAEIQDDLLRRWRLQTERGRIQFKESDGREIVLPFSFRGLAQALDAMGKV